MNRHDTQSVDDPEQTHPGSPTLKTGRDLHKWSQTGAHLATLALVALGYMDLRSDQRTEKIQVEALESSSAENEADHQAMAETLEQVQSALKELAATVEAVRKEAEASIRVATATQRAMALFTGDYAYVAHVDRPPHIDPDFGHYVTFSVQNMVPRQVRGRIVGYEKRGPVCQLANCGPRKCDCFERVGHEFTLPAAPLDTVSGATHQVSFLVGTPFDFECNPKYQIVYLIQVQQPNGTFKTIDRYRLDYRHVDHDDDPFCKTSKMYELYEPTTWGDGVSGTRSGP